VALGELLQRSQRLLKIRHGFTIRRACDRTTPGLPVEGHGLVPYLASQGVVREAFHLLDDAVPRSRF
jgi:hypothetical protein